MSLAWNHLDHFSNHIYRRWILNSIFYSLVASGITLLVGIPAGYGLALGKFPGRKLILSLTLISMIIPAAALVLPIYLELNAVHRIFDIQMIGTSWSVILPFSFFPFGVYLAYIYYVTALPVGLLEAARVDGANELQTFLTDRNTAREADHRARLLLQLRIQLEQLLPAVRLPHTGARRRSPSGSYNLLASTPSFNPAVGGGGQSVNIFKPELALATVLAVIPVAIVFVVSQSAALVRDTSVGRMKQSRWRESLSRSLQGLRRRHGAPLDARPRDRGRRVHGPRRPVRLRQDDGAAHGRGPRGDQRRATIRIGERVVNDLAPKDRDIAMVFQNYALYPHMTVYDNIAFALKMREGAEGRDRRRVDEAARVLGLEALLERKPRALSGGQRQRVAMGRAIVRQPQVFLMDEPLSNLDAKLRVQMRAEIAKLQQPTSASRRSTSRTTRSRR